jgi:hypothetical protein
MIGDWWCSVSIVRVQFSSRDTKPLSSNKSNCNTEWGSFLYASMITCRQLKKQKTKNKTKEKKTRRKPIDAYGRGDYISQYSSIMFTFVYSTRVCNLISTTH